MPGVQVHRHPPVENPIPMEQAQVTFDRWFKNRDRAVRSNPELRDSYYDYAKPRLDVVDRLRQDGGGLLPPE